MKAKLVLSATFLILLCVSRFKEGRNSQEMQTNRKECFANFYIAIFAFKSNGCLDFQNLMICSSHIMVCKRKDNLSIKLQSRKNLSSIWATRLEIKSKDCLIPCYVASEATVKKQALSLTGKGLSTMKAMSFQLLTVIHQNR